MSHNENVETQTVSDSEFSLFCKDVLSTNPSIIEKWINSTDPIKRVLGKMVKEAAGGCTL